MKFWITSSHSTQSSYSDTWRVIVLFLATLAGGLGWLALLGWILGHSWLINFASDRILMAPGTAALIALYGTALFLHLWKPKNHHFCKAGIIASIFGICMSALLFLTCLIGIHLPIENFGLLFRDGSGKAALIIISPLTGICLVLCGVSILIMLRSFRRRSEMALSIIWSIAPVVLISLGLLLVYVFGTPLFHHGQIIMPALTTTLALFLLSISLLIHAGRNALKDKESIITINKRSQYIFALVLSLFILCIVAAGRIYFQKYREHFRAGVEREISSIADLKIHEIWQWRQERFGDASMFLNNPDFSVLLSSLLENPSDSDIQFRLWTWLEKVQRAYDYERVFILDTAGKTIISDSILLYEISPNLRDGASRALAERQIIFMDLYRIGPDKPMFMAVLTPIFDSTSISRPLGVLVLRIDPNRYLYPLIARWPADRKTAETLLVRREGDSVLFLNNLRFNPQAALAMRKSVFSDVLPAAQAVQGVEGIVEGRDYRNIPVLAAVRAIPDSPWFMVSRIDLAEIYAPIYQRLWGMMALMAVLFLFAITAVLAAWQRKQKEHFRSLANSEGALRESEKRFRHTLDCMLEGFQILDREWRYVYINDAAAVHARRTKEELLNRTMPEIFPGIEKTGMFATLNRCLQEHLPSRIDNEFVYPDGSRAWYELSIQPVPEGVAVLSLNIDERKLAEEALAHSEKNLKSIFESARDGILAADIKTEMFIMVNSSFCQMLGYSREEMLKLGIKDIHPTNHILEVRQAFSQMINGKIQMAQDIPVRRKDGSEFYVDINSAMVEIRGRSCLLGIFRDITNRKENEERIIHLNRVLRSIRNVNQLIVREKDRDCLIQSACNLLIEHQSYSRAIIVLVDENNHPISFAQTGIEKDFGSMQELMQSGLLPACCRNTSEKEKIILIENRKETCVNCPLAENNISSTAMCAILDHEDTNLGFLIATMTPGIPADAEEQGLFGEVAGDLAFSLHAIKIQEEMVRAQKEKETLQDRLNQAQKLEAVGRLAGGVAHDFNNMLQTIIGYSDVILDEIEPDHHLKGDLEEIRMAAQRSANLTRQLLAFSRKQAIEPKVLDPNDTISGMLNMLKRLIGEHIELTWKPGNNIPPVKIDPAQMDQILANLVVNARDAIKDTGRIIIETGVVEFDETYCAINEGYSPGKYVMLSVSDDGIGMDHEILKHIFEPFYTTKPLGEGTGLGLSTVYGIIKQNEGIINPYSEPGHGTTVRIYLLAHENEVPTPIAIPMSIKKSTGNETVLLVEDEPTLLKLGQRLLEQMGYKVLACNSPDNAIEISREYKDTIHLLLTDVIMPKMSGRDLWQQLGKERIDLRCILMSGYTADIIGRHGVLEEGIHFLQKPFSMDSLAQKIREVLEEQTSLLA